MVVAHTLIHCTEVTTRSRDGLKSYVFHPTVSFFQSNWWFHVHCCYQLSTFVTLRQQSLLNWQNIFKYTFTQLQPNAVMNKISIIAGIANCEIARLVGWEIRSPFSTKIGYIRYKILGGDFVLPGYRWPMTQ